MVFQIKLLPCCKFGVGHCVHSPTVCTLKVVIRCPEKSRVCASGSSQNWSVARGTLPVAQRGAQIFLEAVEVASWYFFLGITIGQSFSYV